MSYRNGVRREDWKKWLTRATSLGRTAMQLYIGVKRREPVHRATSEV
jgi:hypothetical protein